MSVFIFDKDALEKLGKIEGEAWLARRNTMGPTSFESFHRATLAYGLTGGTLHEFRELPRRENTYIHGERNARRYLVTCKGEIFLHKYRVAGDGTIEPIDPESRQKAEQLGFRLWPHVDESGDDHW